MGWQRGLYCFEWVLKEGDISGVWTLGLEGCLIKLMKGHMLFSFVHFYHAAERFGERQACKRYFGSVLYIPNFLRVHKILHLHRALLANCCRL